MIDSDRDILLCQIDFVRTCLAKTYRAFPDCDPRLRATLMCIIQACRRSHPKLKRFYRKET